MIFQTLGLALFVASVAAQTACNGFDQLCTRLYSNVTFAAAHNAAFVGRLPSHNQLQYPEAGMDMGIRYFTSQVHLHKDNIQQCHSDCALLNVGPFSEMVVSIKKWLDNHPREVVTLLVTNGADSIPVDRFATVFKNAGAESMVYSPSRRLNMDQWPTLGEMISSGKRFVVFMGEYRIPVLSWKPLLLCGMLIRTRLSCRHFQSTLHSSSIRLLRGDAL